MASEMFGESTESHSVVKEFEDFGSRMGMFGPTSTAAAMDLPPIATRLAKKNDVDPEESHMDKSDLGDSPDFYYDGEVGDNTQGKYKSDTFKTGKKTKDDKGKIFN